MEIMAFASKKLIIYKSGKNFEVSFKIIMKC